MSTQREHVLIIFFGGKPYRDRHPCLDEGSAIIRAVEIMTAREGAQRIQIKRRDGRGLWLVAREVDRSDLASVSKQAGRA